MDDTWRFPSAVKHDPAVARWLREREGELGTLTRAWFEKMRACGPDVRELMHDGFPTACAGDTAFAYVAAFKAHVNVGFYYGAFLKDPARILEGTGKRMRHVKLKPGRDVNAVALGNLIKAAYADARARL